MIIAHAHDLDRSVQCLPEILENGRREPDRPLLARNMRRAGLRMSQSLPL
jgi:hypothetical protein